jgi:hypothetical protein
MIEPLTTERLKYYGFDEEQIERLTNWKEYVCFLSNNRGQFFASNMEGKIYSGKHGAEKHLNKSFLPEYHTNMKENFKTFEELFRYAISVDSITIPESKLGKQFDYRSAESSHNFSFNVWLQNFKGWEYGNEITYIENLTRANWVEYLTYCEHEKQVQKEKAEKIKSNWKPKALPPQQNPTKTVKLKVKQIALIHVYEGFQITRENAGEISAKHGYTAKTSGEGLFQDYTDYRSTANRKGKPTPCTPKKLKNKIELFESVVSHLSDNNKQRAIDEIKILKTLFESEYQ